MLINRVLRVLWTIAI